MFYFSYGSNNTQQLKIRLGIDNLEVRPGILRDYVRVFGGYSKRWGGGVSSIHPMKSMSVCGSIVRLEENDMKVLDTFEVGYTREKMNVFDVILGKEILCFVYVKSDLRFVAFPSMRYLHAIKLMLDESHGGVSVMEIRDVDNVYGSILLQ